MDSQDFRHPTRAFDELSYDSPDQFLFGSAPRPIEFENGMVIGGGEVYPEINFTLSGLSVNEENWPKIKRQYKEMTESVLDRAVKRRCSALVLEVELLPGLTKKPAWGIEITRLVREIMRTFEAEEGLKSLMRLTPNDIREYERPPRMRSGQLWDAMMEIFRGGAQAGADMLAIESTGGKEIHDDALMRADLKSVIFSLGVMGVRDMRNLWSEIVKIAQKNGAVASGDTGCGFANTAMVLADQGMIPRVFAAIVRMASISRGLIAYEEGARGPGKDCGYENPYIKAIAGVPISMEGKSSACAHSSPLGNIPAATADLWSNESVQKVNLLGGSAPAVSMEQLLYDCRLFNTAGREGARSALRLRDWLAKSDAGRDPQAYILRPEVVFQISEELVAIQEPLPRTKKAVELGIETLKSGVRDGELSIDKREEIWLERLEEGLEEIPSDPQEFWGEIYDSLDREKFIPEEYGLTVPN